MKSLYKKILAVQMAVKTIKKNGHNDFHNYDYATEQDVLAIKDIMNEHGLVAFPSVMSYETLKLMGEKGGEKLQVFQHIKYTVVDSETGEQVETMVLGQGEDKGDKGAYKAFTGGSKYFYLKFFGVATGDEPEASGQVSNYPKQKNVASRVNEKPQPQAELSTDFEKRRAMQIAAEIKAIQKAYGFNEADVMRIGGLKSPVDKLAERGYAGTLQIALDKLCQQVRQAAQ